MISLLYVFIKWLNNNVIEDDLVNDVRKKLLELNNGNIENRIGEDFIKKYKNVFEEDGIFYGNKVENEFIEFDDYYDYIRVSYGVEMWNEMSRKCFKDLLWSVLFSNKRKSKGIKLNNEGIEDLELRMLEISGKNLINDIKKIDLNNWIKNDGGRRKKYDRGKNVSLILMLLENRLMDLVRDELIKKEVKFISVFDSLMIKKSESKNVMNFINSRIMVIDKSLKFRMK